MAQAKGDVLQEDSHLWLRISAACIKVPKSCSLVVFMSGIVGLLQFEMDLMEKRVCVCVWESFVLVKECAI